GAVADRQHETLLVESNDARLVEAQVAEVRQVAHGAVGVPGGDDDLRRGPRAGQAHVVGLHDESGRLADDALAGCGVARRGGPGRRRQDCGKGEGEEGALAGAKGEGLAEGAEHRGRPSAEVCERGWAGWWVEARPTASRCLNRLKAGLL